MRLIHLLEDLPKTPSKWAETNVESISVHGDDIIFNFDQADLENLKEDLENTEKFLKNAEKEREELAEGLSVVESKLEKAQETLRSYEISPTDTIADLVERNEWQAEELSNYKKTVSGYLNRFREMEKEITELRARKNKATVKRCLTTGRLMAEFGGKTYFLTEKTE
jgi:chromosome segregation ATPase